MVGSWIFCSNGGKQRNIYQLVNSFTVPWAYHTISQLDFSCWTILVGFFYFYFFFLAPFFSRRVWLELFWWAASRHVPFIYRRLRMCRETGPSPSPLGALGRGWRLVGGWPRPQLFCGAVMVSTLYAFPVVCNPGTLEKRVAHRTSTSPCNADARYLAAIVDYWWLEAGTGFCFLRLRALSFVTSSWGWRYCSWMYISSCLTPSKTCASTSLSVVKTRAGPGCRSSLKRLTSAFHCSPSTPFISPEWHPWCHPHAAGNGQ